MKKITDMHDDNMNLQHLIDHREHFTGAVAP